MFDSFVQQLSREITFVFSTHRHCDGLRSLGKQAVLSAPSRP